MNAHFVSIYDKPPTNRTRLVWWRFVERQLPTLVIYLLVATLIGVILAPFMLVTVPSARVRYSYVAATGRCNGEAVVRTTKVNGMNLIESIRAVGDC